MPNSLCKEMLRIVVSLTLNILRHCKTNRTGVGRVGKHSHCIKASRHKLFGAYNSVKIMANALECVIYRSAVAVEKFSLLQNRVGLTARKGVARKNKKRYSVRRCTAASRYHIGCTGAYGRYAGNDCLSVHLLCISNCGERHILLIFALIEFQIMSALLQSLTDAYNTSVTEDAENSAYELRFYSVTFDVLIIQKLNESLSHCKSFSFHTYLSNNIIYAVSTRFR